MVSAYLDFCRLYLTIESAELLGLDSVAKLQLAVLPHALPSILACIKTAAVINVGTATIGAFISAEGYGALILTGIRLSIISLILQVAVPVAVLALVVQFGFAYMEKRFVSPDFQIRQLVILTRLLGTRGIIPLPLEFASESLSACLDRLGVALESSIAVATGLLFEQPKNIGDEIARMRRLITAILATNPYQLSATN